MILSKDIPGGNLTVISQEGHSAVIEEEIRGSKSPWFYWKFKALFEETGTYSFHFTNQNKVGARSAAVSTDKGKTWSWLSETNYPDSQNFSFQCEKPGEYWFCQCIPYMQSDFEDFVAEFKDNPYLHLSHVGTTRKGRKVELVTIREGNPTQAILLTARHHCQESMASYALEGVLRAVMAETDFGRDFRKNYILYAIPFVDKDGVEEGDQGKGRIPRDHARDYEGTSLYPEITAIRAFCKEAKPFLMLDMHCPWIRYASNEYSYMTTGADCLRTIEVERFASILEQESPECAPFHKSDLLRWGVDWNVRANSLTGTIPGYGLGGFAQHEMSGIVRVAFSLETPFANFREKTITAKEGRLYGEGIAHALRKYHLALLAEDEANRKPRSAKLCFAGTIPAADDTAALKRLKDAMQDADYRVGFLNQVFGPDTADARAQVIANAGFNLVSTACCQALEHGYEGLYQALYRLDHADLDHTGTARSIEEQEKVLMKEIHGIRVAFIGYTVPFEALKTLDEKEAVFAVNVIGNDKGYGKLARDIENAHKAKADSVIVLLDLNGLPRKDASVILETVTDFGADYIVECGENGKGSALSSHAACETGEPPVVTITLNKGQGK